MDADYDNTNTVVSQTLSWVATSLNTDGSLKAGSVGQSQLVSGLFDDIAQDIIDEVQPLVDQAQGYASAAAGSSATAQAAATAADHSNTAASGAASTATTAASTATTARNQAQGYASTAQTASTSASNADKDAQGAVALAQDYADVTQAWAEHMPDTIPPNILAVMGVTGDHWSSRWWANQAAITFGSRQRLQSLLYRATADQTVFPLTTPDLAGNSYNIVSTEPLDIFVNGVRLPSDDPNPGDGDWTLDADASTVTFLTPLRDGTLVQIDVLSPDIKAAFGRGVVNVLDKGADPNGVLDSAPAFNAAMGPNRIVLIPPGTYRLASSQPPPAPYTHPHPLCVLIQGFDNFEVIGYGATIIVDDSQTLTEAFFIDRCTDFVFHGLTIQGTRKLVTIPAQANVGLACHSIERFLIEDLHFTGNFGAGGAPIDGVWMVNGTFRNIIMDNAGYGFDIAFMYQVTFDSITCRGSDANADGLLPGPGHIGLSIIYDYFNAPPSFPYNFTSVDFIVSEFITIKNCDFSNFGDGFKTTTGRHFQFIGNRWHHNPGHAVSAATGQVQFAGTPGFVVPNGAAITRNSDAAAYTSTADATVNSTGVVRVPIIATLTGTVGNSNSGVAFTLTSPPAGVSASGVAAGAIQGGSGVVPAAGVVLSYDATYGVGMPPQHMQFIGDQFYYNGQTSAGWGLLLGEGTIPSGGADQISDITVIGCVFDENNSSAIASSDADATKLARFRIVGCAFTGATQTVNVGPNATAASTAALNEGTGLLVSGSSLTSDAVISSHSPSNLIVAGTDAAGAQRNMMVVPLKNNTSIPYFPQGIRTGTNGPTWTAGSGTPAGVVTAPKGSLFSRTDGAVATTLYVCQGGTAWNPVAGV